MEVTKREIIASIGIVAIMMIIGLFFYQWTFDHKLKEIESYKTAVKANDSSTFLYALDTEVGNTISFGPLEAVDPVTYKELNGKYMKVKKVTERYTRHTRRVKSGKHYYTKVYYTWDTVYTERKSCKYVTFYGVKFKANQIALPSPSHLKTKYITSTVRNKYYGSQKKYNGTLFAKLQKNTIQGKADFYPYMNIKETIEEVADIGSYTSIFWIIWILLTIAIVSGFCYLENEWLE